MGAGRRQLPRAARLVGQDGSRAGRRDCVDRLGADRLRRRSRLAAHFALERRWQMAIDRAIVPREILPICRRETAVMKFGRDQGR